MSKYIVLLRGVMPTGKNKVPMALLRETLGTSGLRDVKTYIQSGNVVCSSNLTQKKIEQLVHTTILENIGANITVLARTPKQFTEILYSNPFKSMDPKKQYFTLLSSTPDAQLLRKFKAETYSPDQVRFEDNAIYTCYATKHSESKFNNNYFERKLKVAMTTRNFNTMNRLLELSNA